MTQINADIILPPDFKPVVEVKGPDGAEHKIYADSIGADFLTQALEQNQQLHAILSGHVDLFSQLTPHIKQLIIPENPTPEEQAALNNHFRAILEIYTTFANFSKENTQP